MQSDNHSVGDPSQPYNDPASLHSNDRHFHQTLPAPQHAMLIPSQPRNHSADAPPLPPLPPSLTPSGRVRGQSASNNASNIFFEQQFDYRLPRRQSDTAFSLGQSFYSNSMQRHTQSTAGVRQQPPTPPRKPIELQLAQSSPPPVPPKQLGRIPLHASLPTVPPKISLYPRSIPGPFSPPLPPEKPPQSHEDKDLEIAMLLSEAEANEQTQNKYVRQEEEDLARALEESRISALRTSSTMSSPAAVEVFEPDNAASWDSASSLPSHLQSRPVSLMPSQPIDLDRNTSVEGELSTSMPMLAAQLSNDEALARRIAAEDEPESVDASPSQENVHLAAQSLQSLYSDAVSNMVNPPGGLSSSSATLSVDNPSSLSEPPEIQLSRNNSIRSDSSQQSVGSDQRSNPADPGHPRSSSPVSKSVNTDSSTLSVAWPSTSSEKRSLSIMSSQSTTLLTDGAPSIHANQFVEQELLLGISLGFTPPAISTVLKPMSGPMPNIIALPHGKSPPLHLQAPSWRHLLKLMARLSGTRIEPTLEAMAAANRELKLRTVVQFVKLHHSARDWRMLLYLTIDYPVPANSPNALKFTNGDVGTLPYSYTLSTLPTLLRDGAESAMATYYVVPPTPKTPYPTLPINFPDMAMYLQSALEDSRRAMNDSSSGLRKLAKCVDTFYANEHENVGVEEAPEKRSFGGVFKKVIGRGIRQGKGTRGGNEEVYELVTPFVPEEWG